MKVRKRTRIQARGQTATNNQNEREAGSTDIAASSMRLGKCRSVNVLLVWTRQHGFEFSLLLFNNPLHALEYFSSTRRFFGVLSVLFEIIFLGALFAFWLVEFDDLADEQSEAEGAPSKFHSCTCICGLKSAWFFPSTSRSYLLFMDQSDWICWSTYDYHEDRLIWDFIRVFWSYGVTLRARAILFFVSSLRIMVL